MKQYYPVLAECALFQSIPESDYEHLISCFFHPVISYQGGEVILLTGAKVNYVYIVLTGSVEIAKESFSGSKHIISLSGPSKIFAEGIVCTKQRISPVTVTARKETKVLPIPYQRIMTPCSNSCSFHTKLIFNMMLLLGEKNYSLNTKIELLSYKGMRQKLAVFLLSEQQRQKSLSLKLCYNRNELADYLNVSRPSMSRELSRMQAENILSYHKDRFEIKDLEALRSYAD